MNLNPWSPGQRASIACILEATARKPGNVHRFRDFADATYLNFILSAAAIARPLDEALNQGRGVGEAILDAVTASRCVSPTNTNLGLVLLLAPLAAADDRIPRQQGIAKILDELTVEDAEAAYLAIQTANPSALGTVASQDVRHPPTVNLRAAMALAADRDLIARQYVNEYKEVLDVVLPALKDRLDSGFSLESAIIHAFLTLLAREPDSLIARKRGSATAIEASRFAAACLDGAPLEPFDEWLRADGNARNPGTTADLVGAAIYVALSDGIIRLPLKPQDWPPEILI